MDSGSEFRSWIRPSARNSAAIRTQTRGAGSSVAASCRASLWISLRSETRSEQAGQDFTCVSKSSGNATSGAPSRTSGRIRSTSEHVMANPLPNTATTLTSLGLFGSHEFQKIPQLQSCLVQLRLAIANRASHDFGNLVMLESFYIVQYKNLSVAGRQLVDRALQLQAIDGARQSQILGAEFLPRRLVVGFQRFLERHDRQILFAQLHEHDIDRHAVQPGGEGGLATKGADLAK